MPSCGAVTGVAGAEKRTVRSGRRRGCSGLEGGGLVGGRGQDGEEASAKEEVGGVGTRLVRVVGGEGGGYGGGERAVDPADEEHGQEPERVEERGREHELAPEQGRQPVEHLDP